MGLLRYARRMPLALSDILARIFGRPRLTAEVLTRRLASFLLGAALLQVGAPIGLAAQNGLPEPAIPSSSSVQQLVDDLRGQLAIDSAIAVRIVPANPRIVSVTPLRASNRDFELTIESAFLNDLSADELSAVIAHELGHVWVSTHHPYLQTERLANSIALRVVSRDSLERVYEKVWARDGNKGDMEDFLGPRVVDAAFASENQTGTSLGRH